MTIEHRPESSRFEYASGALDHIRAEDGRVVPACSYVAAYIQRHPDYAPMLRPA